MKLSKGIYIIISIFVLVGMISIAAYAKSTSNDAKELLNTTKIAAAAKANIEAKRLEQQQIFARKQKLEDQQELENQSKLADQKKLDEQKKLEEQKKLTAQKKSEEIAKQAADFKKRYNFGQK